MGMIDYFRKTAETPEVKTSATGPVISYHSAGRVVWSPRDVATLTRTGYAGNPVAYRAVKLIAEAASALPLICEDEGAQFDTHPLLDLLARPNPAQGQADMLEALYAQLVLTGNGYLEAVASDDGLPHELHVLRSDRMSVVPGADGWPVAYEYAVGGRRHRFDAGGPRTPILHVKTFHPQDDHYGLSALQPAAQALDVHNAASGWSKALLDNAARPSGALIYGAQDGQSMTAEQFDRLSNELEAHHMGARNAGRPMLLEGGLDWKPMGFSPSDMEFHRTKEAASRDIALAFGIPPMILGIPGDATYANYAEAHRAFFRLTVLPLATRVTAAIAHWIEGFSGERARIRPDLDKVPALSAERDAQWARVSNADFLTRAEKRRFLGLPAESSDD